MNLRERQETLAIARVYLDGLGYAAVNEHQRDPVTWETEGLEAKFMRGRLVGAVLHAIGAHQGAAWGLHHWVSHHEAILLAERIGRYRGLFVSGKIKPPAKPSDGWKWLNNILEGLALDRDIITTCNGNACRISPASMGRMQTDTTPAYRRFSPRGGYPANFSEVSFLSCGIRPRHDTTALWRSMIEEEE